MPEPAFTLRPARKEDSRAIRSLILRVGINPTGLDWRRFLLAVLADGKMIGCGQIKPHSDGSSELASIAVHPDWRGCGVARAIIEDLLASHRGELFLTCRSRLGPLYEKFGFRTVAEPEMPPYFQRVARLARRLSFTGLFPVDLLVMKREPDSLNDPDLKNPPARAAF